MLFYPYQKNIVSQKDRLGITKKSRQIGGTFAYSFKGLKSALFKKRNQIIVSGSQRQSKIVMNYVNRFMEAYKMLPEFAGLKFEIDQAMEKKLPDSFGGASIYSLPPNPETIRGFNGDVFLDEFALYKNDEEIYEAILPAILRGYDINISSTVYGMSNMFYRVYNDKKIFKDYKRNSINIYEAIKQGLKVDIDLIKNNYDESSFRQEFMAEFIDESTSYFPYSLLRELIEDFEEQLIKGKAYIGIDIGRTHDSTAILVVKEVNGVFYLVRKVVLKQKTFDFQMDIIQQLFHEYNPFGVYIDRGAIGMQLAEQLEQKYIYVTGVNFSNNFISEIVTNAKKLFEQKKFKFVEDKDLISEIHSINKKANTNNNSITFSSKRTTTGHSDSAWALLLALMAGKTGPEAFAFSDVEKEQPEDEYPTNFLNI